MMALSACPQSTFHRTGTNIGPRALSDICSAGAVCGPCVARRLGEVSVSGICPSACVFRVSLCVRAYFGSLSAHIVLKCLLLACVVWCQQCDLLSRARVQSSSSSHLMGDRHQQLLRGTITASINEGCYLPAYSPAQVNKRTVSRPCPILQLAQFRSCAAGGLGPFCRQRGEGHTG